MRSFLLAAKAALILFAASLALTAGDAAAQPPDEAAVDLKLAAEGYALVQKYCYRCHGAPDQLYPGLDMSNRKILLRPAQEDEEPFVIPGDPDASRIWQQIEFGAMPPDSQPQPSDAEKEMMRQWLAAGAHFPPPARQQREFVGDDTILTFIALDLDQMRPDERQFARYFSLAHLWNDPDVSDEMLRFCSAATSKLINSLSYKFTIVPPRRVDPEGMILAIDLRDYGWDERNQWTTLLKRYPYGMQRRTREAERVYELTGCDLPYVRADWFVFAAARPPLYHELLNIPKSAVDLEKQLGVDIARNYRSARLQRAAFAKSGVSRSNRLVERHETSFGAYWKSYDFASNVNEANLFEFPLGPASVDSTTRRAFKHDGGEIIFHLPNGLQAYMLVTDKDERIDDGPIKIVRDLQQFSGTPAVVNGISCMGCHKEGMIPFADDVRATFALNPNSPISQQVLRLYPSKEDMDRLVRADRDRFLRAMEQACGPWLHGKDGAKADFTKIPDPVTKAALAYDVSLTAGDLAQELGLPEDPEKAKALGLIQADEFATAIRVSERLRSDLNLAPVAQGGSLPRDAWERVFQRVARELRLGVPVQVN